MERATLDVPTADGHVLKVGSYTAHGAGPSVLVLHGLYSHMGWYGVLAQELVRHGATVFLVDRRGAGISGGVAGHLDSWHHVVDDLRRVVARIRELRPGAPVSALGVSLGAAMTLAASLVEPGLFERQVALSPGLAPATALPLMRRVGIVLDALARPRVLYELPFKVDQLSDVVAVRDELWADPLRTRAVTSRFLLETFRMQRFVRREIVHLRPPLLALLAERDALVDNAESLRILQRVQGAPVRIDVFENATHVLPACVPLADLVGRMWHWLSADAASLEPRLAIESVPRAPCAGDALEQGEEGVSAVG